jgi:hypothetical protein
MTAPTTHYLTITLPGNKAARAIATNLQPKAERWREQTALPCPAPNRIYSTPNLIACPEGFRDLKYRRSSWV